MNELIMEYNFDWKLGEHRSKMVIRLDNLFQVKNDKRIYATHTKKVIKHILKYGSDENIKQVQEFLNGSLWFEEFEVMRIKHERG